MFDAYTIKKVLPRLVAAVVLIQLSWFIFTTLISMTNLVAYGMQAIIAAPFGGMEALSLDKIFGGAQLNGGTVILTALVAVPALHVAAGGIFAAAIFILLALVVGYFVLAIRRILLIALLIISPLALVAWILPGTQRLWKMWWDNFSKLLIMFPMIIVIITVGRAMAKVIAGDGGGGIVDPAKVILILSCVFVPFFLIPATFKAAGAGLAFAAGWIGGRAGSLGDSARKRGGFMTEDKRKDFKDRASESRLFNPAGRFGKYNNLASTLADPKNAARIKLGTTGGRSLMSQIGQSKFDHTEKMSGVLSKSGFNAEALREIMSWDGSQKGLENKIETLRNSDKGNDRIAANLLSDNAGFLLNAHRSEEYGRGSITGAAGLALASQGFIRPDEIAQTANQLNAEFPGLGNTFKTSAELLGARGGAATKPGYTTVANRSTGSYDVAGIPTQISQIKKLGTQDIASVKAGDFEKQFGNAYKAAFSGEEYMTETGKLEQVSPEMQEELKTTLAQTYASYTNPEVRSTVRKILTDGEMASNPSLTPEQAAANVSGRLRAYTNPNADEIARMGGQEPPQPPGGGQPG